MASTSIIWWRLAIRPAPLLPLPAMPITPRCCGRRKVRASIRFFIDYNMPRPDGPLVAHLLRRRERHAARHTRLTLCSADAQLLSHPEAWQEADAFMLKPVSLNALRAALVDRPRPDALTGSEQQIWQLASRDRTFPPAIIATLRQTLREDRDAISRALALRDWHTLATHMHRMRGSWQLLDIDEGEQLCQRLGEPTQTHNDRRETSDLLLLLTSNLLARMETYDPSTFAP